MCVCVFIHACPRECASMSEHFISTHARIDDSLASATGHFAGKHLSEVVSGARTHCFCGANECKETHVFGSLWRPEAIKPLVSNINCFDLFPLRRVALCRQGRSLIWTENSVKVCKILEGWKCRKITKVSFTLCGTNSNDLEYLLQFPHGRVRR